MSKFPKNLFVKIECDAHDKKLNWPVADKHMYGLVSMGQTEKIAIYKLVEIREATGVVSHKRIK